MDTDFDTTQARYAEYLERVPALLTRTLTAVRAAEVAAFRNLMQAKKRQFFTGVGSSMPAAWHGANLLRQQGLGAQFLPTGAILGLESLSADDVVVLSSQGVNRADALLIIDKVRDSQASLVVLTANPDLDLKPKADQIYYFEPAHEKLFCRPAGVATNYALMQKLCSDKPIDDEFLVDAWRSGQKAGLQLRLPDVERFVVLSSDDMMPIAWNVSLALREGAGLQSELFDIETYGHGNYVGDLHGRSANDQLGYVLVSAGAGSMSRRSVQRIMPFVKGVEAPFCELSTDYPEAARCGLYVLAAMAQHIYDRNQTAGYNMNRAAGKEQNRYYHELESYVQ